MTSPDIMSFSVTINGPEKQFIWGKCLSTVSQICSDIIVTITDDELILSAMNATDTTITKITFNRQFFTSFKFEPRKIVFGGDGIQHILDFNKTSHTIYSFKINGKYLALISLKQDDSMQDYVLSIDNTDSCTDKMSNVLLLRIKTDSLLSKEYQINFEPLKSDQIILSLKYKQKFVSVYHVKSTLQKNSHDARLLEYFQEVEKELQNDMFNAGILYADEGTANNNDDRLSPNDEINFISLEQGIFRAFIDSIMSNVIEEIKLEITSQKFNIIGFTKAVYNLKSKEYLRQAVTVTNTCSLSDLDHYCLFSIEPDPRIKNQERSQNTRKSIVFKLRDFKTFLNGLSCWKTNDSIRIWFCNPGAPVLFEVSKDDVIIELVQITESDASLEQNNIQADETASTKNYISPSKKRALLHESENSAPVMNKNAALEKSSLFVSADDDDENDYSNEESTEQFQFKRLKNPIKGRLNRREGMMTPATTLQKEPHRYLDGRPLQSLDRMKTTIEWGQKNYTSHGKYQELNTNEEKSNLPGSTRKQEIADTDNNDDCNSSMGPTQTDKPKGLFD